MRAAVLALTLVELHSPLGGHVFVNPAEVVTVREPRAGSEGHFARGTHCLLIMANGNLFGVTERCDEVRQKLQ
jgi:hypothetical protein